MCIVIRSNFFSEREKIQARWVIVKNQKPKVTFLLFLMFLITSDFWRSFHTMSLYFLVGNVFRNIISKDGVESSTLKTFDWFRVSDVGGNTEHLSLLAQNQSFLSAPASPQTENEALSHQLSKLLWSKAIPSGWGWMVTPNWERNARGEEATRECREQWWESIPCKCGFSTSPCTLWE